MPAKKKDKEVEIRNDYISVRACAKKLGLKSHNSIIEAMDSGVIIEGVYVHPKNKHRKILYDTALKEWNTHHNIDDTQSEEKRGGGKSTASTLNSVRLKSAQVKLAMDALKLKKQQGVLVEKEAVYKELFEFGRLFRDSILVIPDRIVDEIQAAKTRNEIHSILTDALNGALSSLADINNLKI